MAKHARFAAAFGRRRVCVPNAGTAGLPAVVRLKPRESAWHDRCTIVGLEDLSMSKNESFVDRGLRVVVGVILLSIVFIGPHTLFGLVGIIPLLTGAIGVCPLYRLLGISSCSTTPGH